MQSDLVRRCHWIRFDGAEPDEGEIMIPMCIGCAVNGPDGCTCETPGSAIERAQLQLETALGEVERLREKLARQHDLRQVDFNTQRRMHRRIRELETGPHKGKAP